AASREAYDKVVRPFLADHCFSCHDAKKAKAGLRLDTLGTDFLAGKNADVWHEVINQINGNKMPPEDVKQRPDAKRSFAVVEWVGRELKGAEKAARMAGGKILSRRMNRDEYVNTVRDLLKLDGNFVETLKDDLPADGKAEGFDRLGAALLFDETQLSAYLSIAQRVAEKAVVADERPAAASRRSVDAKKAYRPAAEKTEIIQYHPETAIPSGPGIAEARPNGVELISTPGFGFRDGFGGIPNNYTFALLQGDAVPVDGYYRIRVRAGGFPGERGQPIRVRWTYMAGTPIQAEGEVEVKGTLQEPGVAEAVVFLRKPPQDAKPQMAFAWNCYKDVVITEPELEKLNNQRTGAGGRVQKLISANAPKAEIDAAKARVAELIEQSQAYAKRPGAVAKQYNPKYDLAKVPRLLLQGIDFEGPVEKQWPPASHVVLFPQGMRDDPAQLRAVFAGLLPRAYRRPVQPAEVERLLATVARDRARFKMGHVEAVRYGLQLVLSSPEFLMLFEPSDPRGGTKRPLTDHELAGRLSYFLWSTMPDDELFKLAEAKRLRDPATLAAQVRRMLAAPQARQFAENFAGQWLHVRDFDAVTPAKDYKDYDASLKAAGREEPIAFFEEVLRKDEPVTAFLQSDWTVANERLARFYGVDGVAGPEFRRVALKPEHHRGGVLTMAGLMTYLSDGTRTLPVRRGAWVLEEIFNDPPPPPPPNAGEIQPNAAGKNLTVRQRLEMHRSESTCASCHAKIDPLGLALENYDAIGAWRDRQNGEGFKGLKAPAIDASGKLPNGKTFSTPAEFKQVLLADRDRFARAFSQKVLTYALGRPVGYVDTPTVDAVAAQLARREYRMHALIEAVVTSEPFLTK
ncbi:MAG TPA: DUF1592 domain-containing protein, partial [Humisphaera sp.]